ncbi:MAG TPA: GntR family transcriptional regulator [Dermatophilaceae bacterium]|nr:GntR family transcriptional regulator [Dermatophilaceae bacterium]
MTAAPSLVGLTKVNLREQAVTSLRTAITSGQLPPQSPMVETDLSDRLNISRGTLREAMRQLQQEGLLEAGARGRLYVRHLGPKEIGDIFAVRAALEGLAASTLAGQQDRTAVVGQLRAQLDVMSQAKADTDLEDRIEADLDFHRALCALTGNAMLLHTWESLEGSIRMSIMYAGTERAVGNMDVARHDDIVKAIHSGDPAVAFTAVQEHMSWAAANLQRTHATSHS